MGTVYGMFPLAHIDILRCNAISLIQNITNILLYVCNLILNYINGYDHERYILQSNQYPSKVQFLVTCN